MSENKNLTEPARPTREEFRALAKQFTVVPVWRTLLADFETPVSVFAKLVGDNDGFLLESVEHGVRWGRFSFIGSDPELTLIARGNDVSVTGAMPPGVPTDSGALNAIEALLSHYKAPTFDDLPPFHGGVVGYLGYDVVREVEHLPNTPEDDLEWPDAVLTVTGHVTAFDHFAQRLYLMENIFLKGTESDSELDEFYNSALEKISSRVRSLGLPLPYPPVTPPASRLTELPPYTTALTPELFQLSIEAAKEHILAGDIFQVVLSQRFDLEGDFDPFSVYRVLRLVNPSPYMYLLRHNDVTLVGSSPEPMVQVLGGRVISRPIAGTRFRGRDDAHDDLLAAELMEHPKERAEHVMLVDLARNDLGRVVKFGTEKMDELMSLERYSHVMHLTSQVSGDLAEGKSAVDVLRATFPAGTVSGAPKVRAMEIIDALEPVKRGPYAGVVGYLDFSGNLDTAITIRTMLWRDGKASVQAGAGIVADSDPALEDLECHNKARALLTAAEASRRIFGSPKEMDTK